MLNFHDSNSSALNEIDNIFCESYWKPLCGADMHADTFWLLLEHTGTCCHEHKSLWTCVDEWMLKAWSMLKKIVHLASLNVRHLKSAHSWPVYHAFSMCHIHHAMFLNLPSFPPRKLWLEGLWIQKKNSGGCLKKYVVMWRRFWIVLLPMFPKYVCTFLYSWILILTVATFKASKIICGHSDWTGRCSVPSRKGKGRHAHSALQLY